MRTNPLARPPERLIEGLCLLGAVLVVLVPASPRFQTYTSVDSGVFLYAGWRWLHGALPYREVWDQKPPLIFAINALGLWLGNNTRWGVWALEVVVLTAAAFLGFDLLKRAFGRWSAVYVSFAWLLCAFVTMDGGNYTTEFALPLQWGCLWCVGTAPGGIISVRRGLVVGVLAGLLFWLKQNTIGIPLAIVIYCVVLLVVTRRREFLRALRAMALMFGAVTLAVLMPFVIQGALPQLWSATFLYNVAYTDQTWPDRLMGLLPLGTLLIPAGFSLLAFIGWLFAALAIGSSFGGAQRGNWRVGLNRMLATPAGEARRAAETNQVTTLIAIALIALPIELLLVIYPGKAYDHYYLALLPAGAVLAGLSFAVLTVALQRALEARYTVALFTLGLIAVSAVMAGNAYRSILVRVTTRNIPDVVNYIERNTTADDRVLVWGGETRVNFAAQRISPTRFSYVNPVVKPNFATAAIGEEYLEQVLHGAPRLIVDTATPARPFLKFPHPDDPIPLEIQEIRSSYQETETLDGWTIYTRIEPKP